MSTTLHDDDIVAWSEQQAALLARLAKGERVNGVDWEHVIEEVRDVGTSEVNAVRSHLLQAFAHLLKAAAAPQLLAARGWAEEAELQAVQAQQRFSPAMRQRIDLAQLWAQARKLARTGLRGDGDLSGLPLEVPFELDEVLSEEFDVAGMIRRLRGEDVPP